MKHSDDRFCLDNTVCHRRDEHERTDGETISDTDVRKNAVTIRYKKAVLPQR